MEGETLEADKQRRGGRQNYDLDGGRDVSARYSGREDRG